MITLYGSGPHFGLPDASPFVTKTEILFKMARVPYKTAKANFSKAPKGKIPYIDVGGTLLGDSEFIRIYLETEHGANFDPGLTAEQKAIAKAVQAMCEDRLYWAVVHARWTDKENFAKGPKKFFDDVPAPLRPFIVAMVNRSVKSALHGQGLGRHTRAEVELLAERDLDALSAFLGEKPFLMGATPCGADASIWSMVASALCPLFETPIRDHAAAIPNLVAYYRRGLALWYPDFKPFC